MFGIRSRRKGPMFVALATFGLAAVSVALWQIPARTAARDRAVRQALLDELSRCPEELHTGAIRKRRDGGYLLCENLIAGVRPRIPTGSAERGLGMRDLAVIA